MKSMAHLLILALLLAGVASCAPANFGKEDSPQASGNGPVDPDDPDAPPGEDDDGAPTPTPAPGGCPGVSPDPQACMVAKCKGINGTLRVELTWCTNVNANSNGLQKGDSFPDDPGRFWDWLPAGSLHTYTDYAVKKGEKYTYRAKFRPELPSNTSQVAIPLDDCTCKEP